MAAVMSHNMSDIKKVASFIEECQRMGIEVDPPNINTARGKFRAKDGRVQYGMSAIKGVGSSAIAHIVEEREENTHSGYLKGHHTGITYQASGFERTPR